MIVDNILKLLGYRDDQYGEIIRYEGEEYTFPHYKDRKGYYTYIKNMNKFDQGYHFLSDDFIEEISSRNRENTLESLEGNTTTTDFKLNFLASDICIYNFEVGYIVDMLDNRITGVAVNLGGTNSYDLSECVFPVAYNLLNLSNSYYDYWREIRNFIDFKGDDIDYMIDDVEILNYLYDKWKEDCEGNRLMPSQGLFEFKEEVMKYIKENDIYKKVVIEGINIFKERGSLCEIIESAIK